MFSVHFHSKQQGLAFYSERAFMEHDQESFVRQREFRSPRIHIFRTNQRRHSG